MPTEKPDTLTQQIGVLTRREVEARVLAPIIDALGEEFGRDKVVATVAEAIVNLSREQGDQLAESMGDVVVMRLNNPCSTGQKMMR